MRLHAPLALLLLSTSAQVGLAQTPGSARYHVRFEATWSAQTHPNAYPSGAHFSPLIGATHNSEADFWEKAGLASLGIERMAEQGSTQRLREEVDAEIAAGHAADWWMASGIPSPGMVEFEIELTTEHSLVTLVSMVAPSPDWFVGVDSLPLLADGRWISDITVDLHSWDAGTDSGTDFTSPNNDTNPAEPISLITNGPFFASVPLGTLSFTRLASHQIYGVRGNPEASLSIDALPIFGTRPNIQLDDPFDVLTSPAQAWLLVAFRPHTAFPNGGLVPGAGLYSGGRPGEDLLSSPVRMLPAGTYNGTPLSVPFPLPNSVAMVGTRMFVQGMFMDANGRPGLTAGVELWIGP